jgi:hypothetical protein
MATEYTLYVRHEVYDRLQGVRGRQRVGILDFLDSLHRDPFQDGDFMTLSPEGRPIQAKIIGSFALLYFADHPVCEVKVVDLVLADA